MDTFYCCALSSLRFTLPVANFLKSHMEKATKDWRIAEKVKALPSPKHSEVWSQPSSLPLPSDEDESGKQREARRVIQAFVADYNGKRRLHQNFYLSTKSKQDTNFLFSGHQSFLPILSGHLITSNVPLQFYLPVIEPTFLILQTVKEQYILAVNYQIDRVANHPTRHDTTVSSHITKLVAKVKSQMKAHSFESSDFISIIVFLVALELACDTNCIHEKPAR